MTPDTSPETIAALLDGNLSLDALSGAVARGWRAPDNSMKVMDPDLAIAIADEVSLCIAAARELVPALAARVAVLERMDREAATHVESVICLRTGFTGYPPYVGWKGLGLALGEALDVRDAALAEVARLRAAMTKAVDQLEFMACENDAAGQMAARPLAVLRAAITPAPPEVTP